MGEHGAGGITLCVGIDCEGNHTIPPSVVQIATENLVIIEFPLANGGLSAGLRSLLANRDVLKVFCDSTTADRRSLGIPVRLRASSRQSIIRKGHTLQICTATGSAQAFGPD